MKIKLINSFFHISADNNKILYLNCNNKKVYRMDIKYLDDLHKLNDECCEDEISSELLFFLKDSDNIEYTQ